MPKISHETESLEECWDRMMIVGPAGYVDRTSLDDYDELGHLEVER